MSVAINDFPFLDLRAQFETIRSEVMKAVATVMESQHFILGEQVDEFEREFATFVGAKCAVGCGSGSDALLLALLALDLQPSDEVITTAFTFVATAGSIVRAGAKPVFVDIDAATFNIDPHQIASKLNAHTKAVIPVHLFGLAADMESVLGLSRRHGVQVIEDAAQAVGAQYRGSPVGSIGDFGCFSFFPSKNLGGAGDGGLITTMDSRLADRLRLLRVHGSDRKYHYQILGTNSRLDALQAAILRVKLRHLGGWAEGRRQRAATYHALFQQYRLTECVQLPFCPEDQYHVYNQFVVRCRERNSLREFLKRSCIPTEIYYPEPLHLQPAFQYLGHKPGSLPHTEKACSEVLAIPIYPELSEGQQAAVVRAIARFYDAQ
jgi:dTDP-4-amino-4,6-dideoxygalactose transaminase